MSVISTVKIKCDKCNVQYDNGAAKIVNGCKIFYQGKYFDICTDCIDANNGLKTFLNSLPGIVSGAGA